VAATLTHAAEGLEEINGNSLPLCKRV